MLDSSARSRSLVEWEYVPEGWRGEGDRGVKGWNVAAVVDTYQAKVPAFEQALRGSAPLGVSHESAAISNDDFWAHNMVMSYAYALAIAARFRDELSILDWGGGIGHYHLISKALLPEVRISYHSRDLPLMAARGRRLFPEAHFYDDDSCFARKYDLVVASSSLQYSRDWRTTLIRLADAAEDFLYLSRVPLVASADSFVVLQRAYRHGYDTEYLGWVFNRRELEASMSSTGLTLRREFLISGAPLKYRGAPEMAVERGFLFERIPQGSPGRD